jgi:hypothetical protein
MIKSGGGNGGSGLCAGTVRVERAVEGEYG